MSVLRISRILDQCHLAKATATLPWITSVGEVMREQAKKQSTRLDEWLRKRENTANDEQNLSIDFFSGNGILLAVPKKKVSHQKKRQKLYGPGSKQQKMINHLNKCPSCGHFKLSNALCTHCVGEISRIWKSQTTKSPLEPLQERHLSDVDRKVLYPGRKDTDYVQKLKDKERYLERQMRSLPVDRKD